MIFESMKMSWDNIIHNKLRSSLTMLGIVIGVASIIALITIVQGATDSINDQVSALGVNKVTINVAGTPLKQGLTDGDMEDIKNLGNIAGVSPTISSKTTVMRNDKELEDITVSGKNQVYFQNDESLVKTGRAINVLDIKAKNQVVVVGSDIVEKLFYGENPMGKKIRINGLSYQIIGVLSSSTSFSANSNNTSVVIPYTTALRNLGVKNISSMDVFLQDTSQADATVTTIKSALNEDFNGNEDAYSVFNMGDMIESFQTIMSMMSLLLSGIAGISLVVGGIGIMNMMLVSITERTNEIGLRKALGATPSRIQLQFIIEAIFLSLLGGVIGLLLGSLIAYIAAILIGIAFTISISTIALAIGFSGMVGIIFGYAPARKASRLNPIDALRSL